MAKIMDSLSTSKRLAGSSEVIESSSTIKVLTNCLRLPLNKYIGCLWSSVRSYGVEVDTLKPKQLFFAQFKAAHKSGDVIHLHWVENFCLSGLDRNYSWRMFLGSLCKLIFFKSQGYKLVWTVHNTLAHECSSPLIEYSFRWFLSRLCNDIVVMSEYSRREFARMYGRTKRVHIIPHGNYIGIYPNQVSRVNARHKLGVAPHQKVLLYFGQMRRYKGIDNLIAAFNRLKDSDVVLLMVGRCKDPDLCVEIEQAIQMNPRIHLRLEFIPDEDIQLYMNACDWVVLPFQKILNSGSVLLALSFGRPVIVPQQGFITELISDGEHGYCYDRDRDLVTALSRALATPSEQWKKMCSQAYVRAQKYDWSKIGAQLYQIYKGQKFE